MKLSIRNLLLVFAVLGLAGGASFAQDFDFAFGTFVPFGQLGAKIDGEPLAGAELFFADRPGAYLLLSPDAGWLIDVARQRVKRASPSKVSRGDDGTLRLLAGAVGAVEGPFQVVEGELHATLTDGRRLTLGPKPPLLGLKTSAEIIASDPSYAYRARQYPPNEETIDQLKQEKRSVVVRVFFGSWCSTCSRYLPWLFQVEEALAGSNIRFEYYGLPHSMEDPEAEAKGIYGVPTAIVSIDGKEVDRRDSRGLGVPEKALLEILTGGS